MRRVLLVSYHFPPEPTAGALRPYFLAKHLPEFGYDVTVLTRRLKARRTGSSLHIVETEVWGEAIEDSVRRHLGSRSNAAAGTRQLRGFLSKARDSLFFPDRLAGWIPPALRQGLALTLKERFDAVISTATPATAHVVGGLVSAIRGLPWIADYRDPWSGNHMRSDSGMRAGAEKFLERLLVRRARTITAVSTICSRVATVHGRTVTPIDNAYDPDDWAGLRTIQPHQFVLCHTGNLYDGRISPSLCFAALAALRSEGHPAASARIHFYGANGDDVIEWAHRYGIDTQVEYHGSVPRREALFAQRSASTLLVFLPMDPLISHVLGSKIIEYAGAHRPVIAFGPMESAMRDFIARSGLGWFAGNLDEAKIALRDAYRTFASGRREVTAVPGTILEARDLAQAFAFQLDAAVRAGRPLIPSKEALLP